MSSLRAIRLLNSVEAAITDSAALQTALTDTGRLSEFSVLMSMRGQARRMAASTVTINTFLNCAIARDAIFTDTDANNPIVAQAILKKQTAMVLVAADRTTLGLIMANPTAAGLLKASTWFETYLKSIITNLTPALVPGDYASVEILVTDNGAMGIALNIAGCVEVILASPSTVAYIAPDSTIMGLLVDYTTAITLAAADAPTMQTFAASTVAMAAIAGSTVAMPIVANSPTAMGKIDGNSAAFTTFSGSASFAANSKNALANMLGLTPGDYADISAMVADATALTAIVASANAVAIVNTDSAAVSSIPTGSNLSIVLGSSIAMNVFGNSEAFMLGLITAAGNNAGTMTSVFSNSVAKSFMFTDNIVAAIVANSAVIAHMTANKVQAIPSNRLSTTTVSQEFDGIPAKIMTLTFKANNIGAIEGTYTFGGSTTAGATATDTIGLSGTVTKTRIDAYIGLQWGVGGIGATAAASPILNYFDMS